MHQLETLTKHQQDNCTNHIKEDILQLLCVNTTVAIYTNNQPLTLNKEQIADLKSQYGIIVDPTEKVNINQIYNLF